VGWKPLLWGGSHYYGVEGSAKGMQKKEEEWRVKQVVGKLVEPFG